MAQTNQCNGKMANLRLSYSDTKRVMRNQVLWIKGKIPQIIQCIAPNNESQTSESESGK